MHYCVYADGSTLGQPSGTVCASGSGDAQLVDEFEIPDENVEVHDNMGLVDIAIVALFVLPSIFKKFK